MDRCQSSCSRSSLRGEPGHYPMRWSSSWPGREPRCACAAGTPLSRPSTSWRVGKTWMPAKRRQVYAVCASLTALAGMTVKMRSLLHGSDPPLPGRRQLAEKPNEPAREVTSNADADHPDDDLRIVAPHVGSPGEITEPGLAGDHFRRDHDLPGDPHADRHSGEDARQSRREHDLPEDIAPPGSKRRRGADVALVDAARAAQHVENHREEGAEKDYESDAQLRRRPED